MSAEADCRWLHGELLKVQQIRYPFELDSLSRNGLYFFYEEGETWGHGGDSPRIVRVGTHRQGNFRSRIADHYLISREVNLDQNKPAPKDRSIFRKNIGRALLQRSRSTYLRVWNVDFTSRNNRKRMGHLRDLQLEAQIESQVTRLLRETFSFRYLVIEEQKARMGGAGLEGRSIGTLSRCGRCGPSIHWLGRDSPVGKIRESGLWQVQYVFGPELDDSEKARLRDFARFPQH